jgi:hypothetical protein
MRTSAVGRESGSDHGDLVSGRGRQRGLLPVRRSDERPAGGTLAVVLTRSVAVDGGLWRESKRSAPMNDVLDHYSGARSPPTGLEHFRPFLRPHPDEPSRTPVARRMLGGGDRIADAARQIPVDKSKQGPCRTRPGM